MTATLRSRSGVVGGRLPPLAAPIACGCCLAAGTAYVVANDPSEGGVFLPCPFRSLTGWWCPGCGLTRATHHLFRGDVLQALRFNLFAVLILAALAATYLAWVLHAAGRSVRLAARIPTWAQVAAGTLLLAFAVVRNLPGVPSLRG
jgi:hypothetical protein